MNGTSEPMNEPPEPMRENRRRLPGSGEGSYGRRKVSWKRRTALPLPQM